MLNNVNIVFTYAIIQYYHDHFQKLVLERTKVPNYVSAFTGFFIHNLLLFFRLTQVIVL